MATVQRFGVLWIVAILATPFFALAADVRTGDQLSTQSGEKISQNLYMAGGNVTSAAALPADAIFVGGSLLSGGTVAGDLLAAGGNVTVLGAVGGDVRLAGGNILVNGKVGGDALVAGGQTTIGGAGIGGDLIWLGGTLRVDAPVTGNLRLSGGDVVINSTITGNVTFQGGKLTLGSRAVINGTLTYKAPAQATMEQGAIVRGAVSYSPVKSATSTPAKTIFATILTLALLGKFLMVLACAFVFVLIFRRYSEAVLENATEKPLLEIGRGFAVFVLLPVASVILLVTIIGIPFGVMGLAGYVAALILASILSAIILGSIVHKWVMRPAEYRITWVTILIGAVLYTLLGFIPFIGGIIKFVLILLALGAAAKIKWDVLKEWR